MNFLFVLLNMSMGMKVFLYILLVIVVILIAFLLLRRGNIKVAELFENPQIGAEITEMLDESISQELPVLEVGKEKPRDVSDYVIDEKDQNLFTGGVYTDFNVRFRKDELASTPDSMFVSTSIPHGFDSRSEGFQLMASVPQLVSATERSSHELRLEKSPAAKWETVKDLVLQFLFTHLHKVYGYKNEKQTVFIERHGQDHSVLKFNLKLQTKYHLDLGRRLLAINGVKPGFGSNSETGAPICMEHDNTYDFNLGKGSSFTWDELFSEIRRVFEEYFTAGVTFTGYSGPSSEEPWFMKVDDGD